MQRLIYEKWKVNEDVAPTGALFSFNLISRYFVPGYDDIAPTGAVSKVRVLEVIKIVHNLGRLTKEGILDYGTLRKKAPVGATSS